MVCVHYALLYREASEVTSCEPAAAPVVREAVYGRGYLIHVNHIYDALLSLGGARCGAKIAPADEGMRSEGMGWDGMGLCRVLPWLSSEVQVPTSDFVLAKSWCWLPGSDLVLAVLPSAMVWI